MRLRSLSGSKDNASKSPIRQINCEIILLDPTQPNLKSQINAYQDGSVLFNEVCDKIGGILERDYLGLRYLDKHGQKQWLEVNKSISKQIKDFKSQKSVYMFSLRFKHFPKFPFQELKQDLSRYLLYLQLRRDLYRGRLVGNSQNQYKLAALVLQAETGDFDMSELEQEVKLTDLKILPHITRKSELKILSIYKEFNHLDSREAERMFIEESCQLETYGVEPIAVKDQKGNELFVGITNDGISTFHGSTKTHTFPWSSILKISYSHKLFMFEVFMNQKKHVLGFRCESSHASGALWKLALDKRYFFTLDRATDAKRSRSGGSLFRRKKTYTFSGRSQKELTQSCQNLQIIPQPSVSRSQSMLTLMKGLNSRSDKSGMTSLDGSATLPSRSKTLNALLNESEGNSNHSKSADTNIRQNSKNQSGLGIMVMDFMNALKETPIMGRKFSDNNANNDNNDGNKGNDGIQNGMVCNTENISSITQDTTIEYESDKENPDAIVSEIVDMAIRQRNICLTENKQLSSNGDCSNLDIKTIQIRNNNNFAICFFVIISILTIFIVGISTIILMQSHDITHNSTIDKVVVGTQNVTGAPMNKTNSLSDWFYGLI